MLAVTAVAAAASGGGGWCSMTSPTALRARGLCGTGSRRGGPTRRGGRRGWRRGGSGSRHHRRRGTTGAARGRGGSLRKGVGSVRVGGSGGRRPPAVRGQNPPRGGGGGRGVPPREAGSLPPLCLCRRCRGHSHRRPKVFSFARLKSSRSAPRLFCCDPYGLCVAGRGCRRDNDARGVKGGRSQEGARHTRCDRDGCLGTHSPNRYEPLRREADIYAL